MKLTRKNKGELSDVVGKSMETIKNSSFPMEPLRVLQMICS